MAIEIEHAVTPSRLGGQYRHQGVPYSHHVANWQYRWRGPRLSRFTARSRFSRMDGPRYGMPFQRYKMDAFLKGRRPLD